MPESRLGIDIRKNAIRAVVVKAGLKIDTIRAAAQVPVDESAGEQGLDEALGVLFRRLGEQTDLDNLTANASFANGCVSFRNLSMPFGEPKKIRQVLPFELEAVLPMGPDQFVADYHMVRKGEKTECIAAAVPASAVEAQLESLKQLPVSIESLSVSGVSSALVFLKGDNALDHGIFLDLGPRKTLVILFLEKRIVTIRCLEGDFSENFAALCTAIEVTIRGWAEQTGLAFSPQGLIVTSEGLDWPGSEDFLSTHFSLPVVRTNLAAGTNTVLDPEASGDWQPHLMDPALALAISEPTEARGFNLRQGPFALRKRWEEHKGPAIHLGILALIVIIALCAGFLTNLSLLRSESDDLENQLNSEFTKILPGTTKIIDPVGQVKAAIREAEKKAAMPGDEAPPAHVIDILAALSRDIDKNIKVKIKSFIMSGEGIQVGGTTDTFNSVDAIKAAMEKDPLFDKVTIVSADLDRKAAETVRFRIKANVKPPKKG